MAIDDSQAIPTERASLRDTSALILAAGGFAAAFGAASCCAPLLLGSLGVGSAWLVTVAWVAAPHRLALLLAAGICLISAGGVFVLRSRVATCTPRHVVRATRHLRPTGVHDFARRGSGSPWLSLCVSRRP